MTCVKETILNIWKRRHANLNSFLRVPHGVFKSVWFAFLTLLSKQFEANDAMMFVLMRLRALRRLDPEDDSTLHWRPSVAARHVLHNKFRRGIYHSLSAPVGLFLIVFSQTRLRYVLAIWHGKSVRLSVCRLWHACTLLRGFNFSGIFLHHIVAWPSGNSSTKNHEDRPTRSPLREG